MVNLDEVVKNSKVVKTMEVCSSTSILLLVRLEKALKAKHDSKNKNLDELTTHKRVRKEMIGNIERGGRKLEKKNRLQSPLQQHKQRKIARKETSITNGFLLDLVMGMAMAVTLIVIIKVQKS